MAGFLKKNIVNRFLLNPSAFRLTYIFTLFFCSIAVVEWGAITFKYVLMAWAGYIFFFYYLKNRRILNIRYCRWLVIFLMSTLLTALIHVTDNFLGNFVMFLHIAICFFIFYGMHTERNKRRVRKEMYWFCKLMVIITTVLAACGIPFVLLNLYGDFQGYHLIVYENRFTGLYTNPNLLGFSSAVAIVCCHMLTRKKFLKHAGGKKASLWLLLPCAILNLVSLFLSDSNAAMVLLIFYVVFYLVYRVFRWQQDITLKAAAKKLGKLFAVCLVAAVALVFARELCQLTAGGITSVTTQQEPVISKDTPAGNKPEGPVSFNHLNDNIDSGRIRLLMESAVLIGNHPLFGIGKENLVLYGERYIEGGLHFSDLHNGYLTVIVCGGIVGFVIFVAFALHVARHIIKSLFLEKKNLSKTAFPILFAFICAYCVYAVFEKTLLFEQTFMVVSFWLMLGYASCFMVRYDHLEDKIELKLLRKKDTEQAALYDTPTEDDPLDEQE